MPAAGVNVLVDVVLVILVLPVVGMDVVLGALVNVGKDVRVASAGDVLLVLPSVSSSSPWSACVVVGVVDVDDAVDGIVDVVGVVVEVVVVIATDVVACVVVGVVDVDDAVDGVGDVVGVVVGVVVVIATDVVASVVVSVQVLTAQMSPILLCTPQDVSERYVHLLITLS